MVATHKKQGLGYVKIPMWVSDLESFRRWSDHRSFPEVGRVSWYDGVVHVDMSKEQIFTHVALKSEFFVTVGGLTKAERKGRFLCDGAYVTNEAAGVSHVPDGVFVSWESHTRGLVRFIEGRESGFVELEGSPDMVLEILSDSSVQKDTVILRKLYWLAGIREYWLVDARGDKITFEILRHTPKGYVSTRMVAGWVRSQVFGKSFRLTQRVGDDGQPEYELAVQ